MIYKNKNIPNNYNRIAEISDNYVVWVKESTLNNNTSYSAYIQFLSPSFSYFYTDEYKIKSGSSYTLDYNYYTSNFGSYIDSADVSFTSTTLQVDDNYITNNDTARSDAIFIFWGQIGCIICILWVFKQMSRLFFRGGLY